MKSLLRFCIYGLAACAVAACILNYLSLADINLGLIAGLNTAAFLLLVLEGRVKASVNPALEKLAKDLGVEHRFQKSEALLSALADDVSRKNQAFSINILDEKIATKEQLSNTLERIVHLAYRIFKADSAELALFDRTTNLYHSSIVIGTPFRTSSQAMLSGAAEGSEVETRPDVLVQPLSFAGSILGTLRIGLRKDTLPRMIDQEILKLLGLQASVALINAQYTQELVRMKSSAEQSVKARTGFLANLSHEIRAPLGIMLNAVELVLDGICGEINSDQKETLGMVHKNGEHLLELINDVLDYAKLESGRIQTNKCDIIVNELLADVCNVVRTQADAKSHRLQYRESSEALAVSCDRRHARQIMINLLTNAIKYTPDGGQIEVWCERTAQGKVSMHVKDSGVGIPDSAREKVFAPFERLDNAYSQNQAGTGLGMSLTKKLAEANGGFIDFSSEEGKGSDFWFTLPAVEVSSIVKEPEAEVSQAVKGAGEAILLVEQDDGERGVVARYLNHHGFNVFPAADKAEAVSLLKSKKIELAIVDNKSADESSDDVIKVIRQGPETSSMPIILVSSRGFVFDIERYLKSGIDRCLIKPLKLAELSEIVRMLLDGTFKGEVLDAGDKSLIESHSGELKPTHKSKVIRLDVIGKEL